MARAISRFRKMNSKSSIGNESVCETGKLAEESILLFSSLDSLPLECCSTYFVQSNQPCYCLSPVYQLFTHSMIWTVTEIFRGKVVFFLIKRNNPPLFNRIIPRSYPFIYRSHRKLSKLVNFASFDSLFIFAL
jgi:hypothetical protein